MLPSGSFPYSAVIFERDRRMSLRRSPFPGFLSLLTGGWRSSDSWVCSAPLALRGLWSSELYVTSGRLPSLAPSASLAVYRLLSGFFRGLRGFPYLWSLDRLLAASVRSVSRPRFAPAPGSSFPLSWFPL